jgi:short-subunit dehydrogenase
MQDFCEEVQLTLWEIRCVMRHHSTPAAESASSPPRVALVIGASAGLGAAVAEEFVARGHAVGIVGRSVERLGEVRHRLESAEGRVLELPGDFADLEFAE